MNTLQAVAEVMERERREAKTAFAGTETEREEGGALGYTGAEEAMAMAKMKTQKQKQKQRTNLGLTCV